VSVEQHLAPPALTPAALEAIAERTAEILLARLRPDLNPIGRLVGVDELAEILSVEPKWVYEHSAELGVVRLGSGPKAPLRFDPRRTLELLAEQPAPVPAAQETVPRAPQPRRRGRRAGGRSPLPIRPERA
jgi:hypothetical protein